MADSETPEASDSPDAAFIRGIVPPRTPPEPRKTVEDKAQRREAARIQSRERRIQRAREAAKTLAEQGSRVHLWTTTEDAEVGPAIEAFESEGWILVDFSSHFRDYHLSAGAWGAASTALGALARRSGAGGEQSTVGDLFSLLFRYAGDGR